MLTAFTVAEKLVLLDPAATVTDAGTVTDELLLDKVTLNPPVAAGELNATVQLSVVAPKTDPLVQVSELNDAIVAVVPVPLRLTTILLFEDESLVMVI